MSLSLTLLLYTNLKFLFKRKLIPFFLSHCIIFCKLNILTISAFPILPESILNGTIMEKKTQYATNNIFHQCSNVSSWKALVQFRSFQVWFCGKVMTNAHLTCCRWLFEHFKFENAESHSDQKDEEGQDQWCLKVDKSSKIHFY